MREHIANGAHSCMSITCPNRVAPGHASTVLAKKTLKKFSSLAKKTLKKKTYTPKIMKCEGTGNGDSNVAQELGEDLIRCDRVKVQKRLVV